jgi:EF hand domain-containing protein
MRAPRNGRCRRRLAESLGARQSAIFYSFFWETRVFDRQLPLAALILFGAAPLYAATAAAQPAAKSGTNQVPTRATVINSMQANFKAIDTNGDGTLNASEIQVAEGKVMQQRVAAVRNRIAGEFTKLDTNKDGQLSKAEFMAAVPSAPTGAPNGAKLLSELDKNKDGKVSIDEYRAPMLARFDSVDTNHDGTISTAERQAAEARAKK